jgi:hypothetical protein
MAGSKSFPAAGLPPQRKKMQPFTQVGVQMWTGTTRNDALWQYARWEYGGDSMAWLIADVYQQKMRKSRGFARRLRGFLNFLPLLRRLRRERPEHPGA